MTNDEQGVSMRIIGGIYRSRLISMPKGAKIRPTQDKVRQAVFNMLGDFSGKSALDLFAGSGAFGIEALSRGAGHATFIDDDARCVNIIKTNLESIAISQDNYDIIKADAINALARLNKSGRSFDIVFADPPYGMELAKKSLIILDSCDILTRTGLVVIERSRKDAIPEALLTFKLVKERYYGETVISIFRKIYE
jgi:16S rRNA (guanine(966)-N(2))-methyltransferase RsmD